MTDEQLLKALNKAVSKVESKMIAKALQMKIATLNIHRAFLKLKEENRKLKEKIKEGCHE